jgi:phosphoesterase RecJ-like protein
MQFIGHILANKLHILEGLNTALMVIDRNELRKYDIITGDTEGLVNYGLSISGVKLAILVIDRTVRVKMSFRGKGTFPCNEFARKYFKGGGHFNAAGGESEDPLEVVVANIKTYLQEYKHLLNP